MIHQSLIDAARNIVSDFHRKQAQLEGHIQSSQVLRGFIEEQIEKVKQVSAKVSRKEGTLDDHTTSLMDVIDDMDRKAREIASELEKVNKEIESLREQEVSLYKLIKSRYPSMSDEQIRVEVQSRI